MKTTFAKSAAGTVALLLTWLALRLGVQLDNGSATTAAAVLVALAGAAVPALRSSTPADNLGHYLQGHRTGTAKAYADAANLVASLHHEYAKARNVVYRADPAGQVGLDTWVSEQLTRMETHFRTRQTGKATAKADA